MARKSDPLEWHLRPDLQGYWIVDGDGEDVAWAAHDFDAAKAVLDEEIEMEIEAREQECRS